MMRIAYNNIHENKGADYISSLSLWIKGFS